MFIWPLMQSSPSQDLVSPDKVSVQSSRLCHTASCTGYTSLWTETPVSMINVKKIMIDEHKLKEMLLWNMAQRYKTLNLLILKPKRKPITNGPRCLSTYLGIVEVHPLLEGLVGLLDIVRGHGGQSLTALFLPRPGLQHCSLGLP